jgi:hypothetical protein
MNELLSAAAWLHEEAVKLEKLHQIRFYKVSSG